MTTTSPCASAKPAWSAAALPKLRRSRTTRTLSCAACSRVSAANVPSVEPSSTNTASQGSLERLQRRGELVVQERDAALLVVHGDDRPRSRAVSVCARWPTVLSIEEALARVLARVRPLEPERVPVAEAAGRVLAEDAVRARRPAAVPELGDGRLRDQGGGRARTLPIVLRIAAGRPADRPLEAGEAMEISTGGAVPDGADAVVPIEHVVEKDNAVDVPGPLSTRERNVRPRGRRRPRRRRRCSPQERRSAPLRSARSLRPGSPRSRARGARVSPSSAPAPSCGARASRSGRARSTSRTAPCSRRRSRRRARVVERIAPVADDEDGAPAGARAGPRGRRPRQLRRRLRRAARPRPRGSWRELGVEEDFWGVAVQAGQAGRVRRRAARRSSSGCRATRSRRSSAVELFVRPALRALQGDCRPGPHYERARLASPLGRNAARDELVRARTRARRRRDRARAGDRPGVAHDRPRRRSRCARARPRAARASSPAGSAVRVPAALVDQPRAFAAPRPAPGSASRRDDGARRTARAARAPRVRVRRVAACGERRQLRRRPRARRAPSSDRDPRHVADRDEREQVPRRVERRGRSGSRTRERGSAAPRSRPRAARPARARRAACACGSQSQA